MLLESATVTYREFRSEYLKLVGGVLAFLLGPWIGFQVRRSIMYLLLTF